jgi:hypothetical protein
MSEDTEPEGTQPSASEAGFPGAPPPPQAAGWGPDTSSGGPGYFFTPAGPDGWSAPPGTWGAPPFTWGERSPARPARSARVHVIWLVVALVAALGCGAAGFVIGKSSAQISAAIKSDGAAVRARTCAVARTPARVGRRLARELLPRPRGAKYLKGRYQHQVDSLRQFLSTLYPDARSEKSRLVARCFLVAAQQGWVLPAGQIVAVYLVRFGYHADARSYALAAQTADLTDPRNKRHGAVAGVSDGMLIEAPAPDKLGNTVSRLIGDKGSVAIIVHVFVPAHLPSRSFATGLLRRQAARL